MSFFKKDDKKAAPAIPGMFKKTTVFGRPPLFTRAAGGLSERLKNLSRKDMAFVAIGLSILVMAPVAEYMMNQPGENPNLTGSAFQDRRGMPYEPGINGLSTGSADGSGEVITPLSSRDPASLILGSQPAQPAAPPPSAPPGDWRDAVKDSGRAAFSAAAKSAGAPTPVPRMQGGLRSMSFFGGDGSTRSSGSLGGGAIIDKAKAASGKAASRSMVGPVASAGYKGVASSPNSASRGAMEKLRLAAGNSAGYFSGGSATGSLDKAAAESITPGSGDGGPGYGGRLGDETAGTKPYDNKYTHMRSGESLSEMAAKMRLQKALEWEFFLKYDIPKKIINDLLGAFTKGLGDSITEATKKATGGGGGGGGKPPPPNYCFELDSSGKCTVVKYPLSICGKDTGITCDISKCCKVGPIGSGGGDGPGIPPGGDYPDGGAPPPPNDHPTNTPPQPPPGIFEDYDAALKMMLQDATQGEATQDAKELLNHSKAIAGGFANLKAGDVVKAVKGASEKARNEPIRDYRKSVEEANTNFAFALSKYRVFRGKFDALLKEASAEPSKLKVGAEAGRSAEISGIKGYLVSVEPTLDGFESEKAGSEGPIKVGQKLLAFHNKSLGIYNNQTGYVDTLADGVKSDYDAVTLAAGEVVKKLEKLEEPINSGTPTAEQVKALCEGFTLLTGIKKELPPPQEPPAGALSLNIPAPSFEAGAGPMINKALLWRGLPSEISDAMSGSGLNDAAAVQKEAEAWSVTTPRGKLTEELLVDMNNMAKSSLFAGSIRSGSEIPKDAGDSKMDPMEAAKKMDPVLAEMERVKARLLELKVDLDNPTGTGTGSAPPEDQAKADKRFAVISACSNLATGFNKPGAGECSIDQATRLSTIVTESDIYRKDPNQENLAYLENNMRTACNWVRTCRPGDVPAGCN